MALTKTNSNVLFMMRRDFDNNVQFRNKVIKNIANQSYLQLSAPPGHHMTQN